MKGILSLVGVPIGNDEDITLRALKTLQNANYILAEDTRKAKTLFNRLNISLEAKTFIPHHEHNEVKDVKNIVEKLEQGVNICFVSDAGMPTISDPGFVLLKECQKNNINVKIIPGVSAVTTAIACSGLSPATFVFDGFLPKKESQKEKRLLELSKTNIGASFVFFESPHRLIDTLKTIEKLFGENQKVSVCRELTKIYEEVSTNTVASVLAHYSSKVEGVKGEIAIVLDKIEQAEVSAEVIKIEIENLLKQNIPSKQIKDIIHEKFNISKKDVYNIILNSQ